MLRTALIRLRREFNDNPKRFAIVVGTMFGVSLLISLLLDAFTPFGGIAMIARSFLLIPLGASAFAGAYIIGLLMHRTRVANDEGWVPFRMRYSPMWRRRIAALIAAILVVVMYASGFRIGYTFTAGLVVAAVIALLAFIRTTREEAAREAMNIPDSRDVKIDKFQKERDALRSAKVQQKQKKRAKQAISEDELD